MKPQKRKLKLTGWYSGVNPLRSRPGWYEVYAGGPTKLIYWSGDVWAMSCGDFIFLNPIVWRGLSR